MSERIPYKVAPGPYQAMLGLEKALRESSLEGKLIDLVKLRASQMNGCAFCIDKHWKDLRAGGESEMKLYGLDAWREFPGYSDRERAALAWTEAVTRLGDIPDALFEDVRRHFSDVELAELTYAAAMINAWNRIAIPLRPPVGPYRSLKTPERA
jgi:AhpD family alkylhydroperoxidase